MSWTSTFRLGSLALVAALTSTANAQGMPDGFGQMWIDTTAMGSVMEEAAKEGAAPVRRGSSAPRTLTGDDANTASRFTFQPSARRRQANLAQFVGKMRAVDPKGGAELEKLFASADIIGDIGAGMRKNGLQPNDVADAYALWWVTAWHASQGRALDLNPATLSAVRTQAARAIEATGKFGSASDTLRQEMAESLMIQAAMVDELNDQMRGNPNQRRALATAVNKGARGMGLDLTTMTLTREGFQPRRRGDAGEAIGDVEGAEPEALAAVSVTGAPANDTNDRTGTYALIAAAGGAGLAGMFMAGRAAGRKG